MVNEIKTVLQVLCLAVLLIVLVLAGFTFYRFNSVLEDFRESFIFQPVLSDRLASVESLVPETGIEEILELSSVQDEEDDPEASDSLRDSVGIKEFNVPGISESAAETEPPEDSPSENPQTEQDEPVAPITVVNVDTGNICNRTPEIQQLLIERLQIKSCRDITGEELVRVRALELDRIPLKVGDLDGFINLTNLTVVTDEVSVGLFDDLASLEYLGMAVRTPPSAGLFQNLAALKGLELVIEPQAQNDGLALQGIFQGLSDLEHLELDVGNGSDAYAVALLKASLTGMPMLQRLEVSNVSRVESGVFADLPALRSAGLRAINLPDHLSKPSLPSDIFIENPDLESISLNGFKETSILEFHSLDVVCRMRRNIDLAYGVDFAVVVEDKVVEVVDYDWDGEALECTLRTAPIGSENWEEMEVEVPPLPQPRRN